MRSEAVGAAVAALGRTSSSRPSLVALVPRGAAREASLRVLGEVEADVAVTRVDVDTPEALDVALTALPPIDVVVDLGSSWGPGQLRRWRVLAAHVEQGGAWVAARTPAEDGKVERLAERLDAGPGPVVALQDRIHLRTLVPDHEATALLATREPALDVETLATVPAVAVTRATQTDHGVGVPPRLPDVLPAPEAVTRRYRGDLVSYRGASLVTGRSVLPDSFRWHASDAPENAGLTHVGERWARVRPNRQREPVTRLEGPHFYLDYVSTGHFGHFMTEALAKLWGWVEAERVVPDLRLLLRDHPLRERSGRIEHTLTHAFGIPPERVTWVTGQVHLDEVVASTPLWHNAEPYHAHPTIRATWRRLTDGLVATLDPADADAVDRGERLFVTRRDGHRMCRNLDEVEALFAAWGYAVVDPRTLTLAEQALVLSRARVVAGFGGAGMFNLVHAHAVEAVVVLNHNGYQARNEHLFAAVHDVPSHFFWSGSDGADDGSYRAHQARWRFDVEACGPALSDVLEGLG